MDNYFPSILMFLFLCGSCVAGTKTFNPYTPRLRLTRSAATAKTWPPTGQPAVRPSVAVTDVTACLLLERGNPRLLYDYDKAAAGIDLAVEYVNENVLPPSLRLRVERRDIGGSCGTKSNIINQAMKLWQQKVDCAVYIGPGCGATAESLYNFADFFHTPIIGCPAAGKCANEAIENDLFSWMFQMSWTNLKFNEFTTFNSNNLDYAKLRGIYGICTSKQNS
ncbi:hypothetical protein BV898_09112 [Hypsibius exemplaris]|uniref:Receptor ligand binding region domain-containing protein n=1 Tax=Hypsibius exemplaris TaxID=2072580 RepID=A0A1W0WNG6_HYPEX|nr:hypothetical protein BV898_09112 [Hypsibius exemplaris]